eukprot:scaffold54086_cov27-Tisochrysis_lutea.AAC.3
MQDGEWMGPAVTCRVNGEPSMGSPSDRRTCSTCLPARWTCTTVDNSPSGARSTGSWTQVGGLVSNDAEMMLA